MCVKIINVDSIFYDLGAANFNQTRLIMWTLIYTTTPQSLKEIFQETIILRVNYFNQPTSSISLIKQAEQLINRLSL